MALQRIALPLPHAWFEADTKLPTSRNRTERGSDAHPIRVVAARLAVFRPSEPVNEGLGNVLDSAQRRFDSYFQVVRADGPPVELLRTAIASTLQLAVENIFAAPRSPKINSPVWPWAFTGSPTGTPTSVDADVVAGLTPVDKPVELLNRWLTHHQLFFVMVHAMLYQHAPVVRAILSDFTDVMRGSAQVFRQAADFSVDDYMATIRPDMAAHDPHFPGCFMQITR